MSSSTRIRLLTLLLVLSPSAWCALTLRTYDVRQGLCDNYVQSIAQDRSGFLWLATLHGLSRYDGYRFRTYALGLAAGGDVKSVSVDGGDHLWLRSADAYLVYSPTLDRFVAPEPTLRSLGITGTPQLIDVGADGSLLVATATRVYRYTYRTVPATKRQNVAADSRRRAKSALVQAPLPRGTAAVSIAARGRDTYVLLSGGTIAALTSGRLTRYATIPASPSTAYGARSYLYLDTAGRLWTYTKHQRGLTCYAGQAAGDVAGGVGFCPHAGDVAFQPRAGHVGFRPRASSAVDISCANGARGKNATSPARGWKATSPARPTTLLPHTLITSVIDDGRGHLLVATDNKGIITLPTGDIWNRDQPQHDVALPDNHINTFFIDRQQNLWVGTAKHGAVLVTEPATTFTPHHFAGDVKTIASTTAGLYLGLDGEGLYKVRNEKWEVNSGLTTHTAHTAPGRPLRTPHSALRTPHSSLNGAPHSSSLRTEQALTSPAIPSDIVVGSTTLCTTGDTYFATFGGGVFPLATRRALPFPALRYTHCLASDNAGRLYCGTFWNGLYVLLPQRGGWRLCHAITTRHVTSGAINDLVFDGVRTLYVATTEGLFALDTYTLRFHRIPAVPAGIMALALAPDGTLYAGTRDGLLLLHPQGGSAPTRLTTADGLSHNSIRSLAFDHYGTLWAATADGVTRLLPGRGTATPPLAVPYHHDDGAGDMTFNSNAILATSHQILIGATDGLLAITPEAPAAMPRPHRPVFTELLIGGKTVEPQQADDDGRVLLDRNIALADAITLDASDRYFALCVSDLCLSAPSSGLLYRLGPTEPWRPVAGGVIEFQRMAPGTVTVEVRGQGATAPVSTLAITIRPPFYRSPIAYTLYAAALIAIVAAIALRAHRRHRRAMRHISDEAKLTFFTSVSHDLRTPLALVLSPVERLLAGQLPEAVRQELLVVRRNAHELLNQVNQLLDFRRLDRGQEQLHASLADLAALVRDTCRDFQPYADQHHVALHCQADGEQLTMFDAPKVRRIVLNLLSNAVKYNRPGGRIDVELTTTEGVSTLRVADTGIGISPENRTNIFRRFFQEQHTDGKPYTGSGIGLHIVKQYVDMHHGTITVADTLGGGTTFVVTLAGDAGFRPHAGGVGFCPHAGRLGFRPSAPLIGEISYANGALGQSKATVRLSDKRPACGQKPTPPACGQKPTPPACGQKPAPPTPTLLIVEDNDDFRAFLASELEPHYHVLRAENGREALQVLEHNDVALVITDVMMPVMDGLQLTNAIKQSAATSHIPVVLLTAKTAEEHVIEGLREGADEYIAKPFNRDILLLRIDNLLARAEQHRRRLLSTDDIKPADIAITHVDQQLVERAIALVEQHMSEEDYSVEQLAADLGVSRSGLYKKFMALAHTAPLEFIRTLRLKRGRQYIEQGGYTVAQAAYRVGLSPKQFARHFKEYYGCLPSEIKGKTE